MLIQIGDDHIGTFLGISDRNCTADAGIAAGDDGDLVLQFAAAFVPG